MALIELIVYSLLKRLKTLFGLPFINMETSLKSPWKKIKVGLKFKYALL